MKNYMVIPKKIMSLLSRFRRLPELFRKRPWAYLLGFIVICVAGGVIAFRNVGIWLVVNDPLPEKLDAICTFAGENVRVKYSRILADRYPDLQWFLSDHLQIYRNGLKKKNFQMERLTTVDTCTSTIAEVTVMAAWIETLRTHHDQRGDSAALNIGFVSSPYHMRRIKFMIGRRITTKRVQLYFVPVPCERYSWTRDSFRYWWHSDTLVPIITLEVLKLGYFFLTGYF